VITLLAFRDKDTRGEKLNEFGFGYTFLCHFCAMSRACIYAGGGRGTGIGVGEGKGGERRLERNLIERTEGTHSQSHKPCLTRARARAP